MAKGVIAGCRGVRCDPVKRSVVLCVWCVVLFLAISSVARAGKMQRAYVRRMPSGMSAGP